MKRSAELANEYNCTWTWKEVNRVNGYEVVSKKNGIIKEDTQTPGLQTAMEKLQYLMMNDVDRMAYERHMDALRIQEDVLGNARREGLEEGYFDGVEKGLAEGMTQGMAQGMEKGMSQEMAEGAKEKQFEIARNLRAIGMSIEQVAQATGLSAGEIENM